MKNLLLSLCLLISALGNAQTFTNYPILGAEMAFELAHVETEDGVWVAAVYHFVLGDGDKVSIMRSFDNGMTWTEDTVYADVVDPAMCLDNNGDILLTLQHVSFGGTVLELHRSSDNGDHFTYFSALPASGMGDKPWIVCDNAGHCYATWTSIMFSYNVIGFARSEDNCNTWSEITEFIDPVNIYLCGSFLTVGADDILYLTYGESVTGNIYFTKSSNFGTTWSEPIVIAEMPTKDFSPMTYAFASPANDNIGVLASIAHNPKELLYLHSEDGGTSWAEVWLDSAATNPTGIMQHNNSIHILYTHFPGNFDDGYYGDTRYITSTDLGASFSDPLTLLEGDADLFYSTYIGEYAQASIGSDTELHVSWVRKTTDIGFTHTLIDIPADTTIHEDTTTTAIIPTPENTWSLAPNPVQDVLTIHNYRPGAMIEIYATDGRKIDVPVSGNTIDFSNQPAGCYFILCDGKKATCLKL